MKKHNNFIKKIMYLILLLLCFNNLSCTKKTNTVNDSNKIKITATFYPIYIMCMNIVKDIPNIELNLLAPKDTGCLHDYAITTKDMTNISSCNILVANGAGMEAFLDKAIEMKKDETITAADGFPLIEDNAHIWVSVKGARYELNKIAQGLAKLDSQNASKYISNANEYDKKLELLENEMAEKLSQFKNSKIITFHEAFPYFADEFNLDIVSVIEREPGTVPSAKELSDLILQINEAKAQNKEITLYAETQYSSSSAQIIAKETGLKVYELDPCVTGDLYEDAYIDAQKKNLAVLLESLSSGDN